MYIFLLAVLSIPSVHSCLGGGGGGCCQASTPACSNPCSSAAIASPVSAGYAVAPQVAPLPSLPASSYPIQQAPAIPAASYAAYAPQAIPSAGGYLPQAPLPVASYGPQASYTGVSTQQLGGGVIPGPSYGEQPQTGGYAGGQQAVQPIPLYGQPAPTANVGVALPPVQPQIQAQIQQTANEIGTGVSEVATPIGTTGEYHETQVQAASETQEQGGLAGPEAVGTSEHSIAPAANTASQGGSNVVSGTDSEGEEFDYEDDQGTAGSFDSSSSPANIPVPSPAAQPQPSSSPSSSSFSSSSVTGPATSNVVAPSSASTSTAASSSESDESDSDSIEETAAEDRGSVAPSSGPSTFTSNSLGGGEEHIASVPQTITSSPTPSGSNEVAIPSAPSPSVGSSSSSSSSSSQTHPAVNENETTGSDYDDAVVETSRPGPSLTPESSPSSSNFHIDKPETASTFTPIDSETSSPATSSSSQAGTNGQASVEASNISSSHSGQDYSDSIEGDNAGDISKPDENSQSYSDKKAKARAKAIKKAKVGRFHVLASGALTQYANEAVRSRDLIRTYNGIINAYKRNARYA